MATLTEIALAGAAASERFVRESVELDKAWAAGSLDEFLAAQLAEEKRQFYGDFGNTDGDGI